MPSSPARALLIITEANVQRHAVISRTPFTIGRLDDRDLVLPYPYISRAHAQIASEDGGFYVVDQGSQSGTFLNGRRTLRHLLTDGDILHIGSLQGPALHFRLHEATTERSLHTLLSQIPSTTASEPNLGRLGWFVQAARRLNNLGAVNEILTALIEATLQLTRVERGFVFLSSPSGALTLAAGRDNLGRSLADDSTVSRSAIQQAIAGPSDFIVTDTLAAQDPSHSVLAQKLRTIICIPLRRRVAGEPAQEEAALLGVLYLDSQRRRRALTRTDSDLLTTIATEAAVLVENAAFAQAEEAGRRYREELKIAAEIQQGLMTVRIPELPFARVSAHSIPCTGIGGDFYDVLSLDDGLYVVVADVSGKGVSAAILGATLQGLIHAQLLAGQPLSQIALFANRYICNKGINKYATLVLLHLSPEGVVEYISCGHVPPLLHTDGAVQLLPNANVPVGLIPEAMYTSDYLKLSPEDRILIATDGITEAEDPAGQCYGDTRLRALITSGASLHQFFDHVAAFTQGAPFADDCTLLEVHYTA